jgi:hypothetical protein
MNANLDRKEWLNSLKVGDTVIAVQVGALTTTTISHVTSATRTLIRIEKGQNEYRRDDGCLRGGSIWNSGAIEMPTAGLVAGIKEDIQKKKAVKELSGTDYQSMSLSDLLELLAALRRVKGE